MINRHAVLRSAVLWEKLPQPVQVVYRFAALSVEDLVLGRGQPGVRELHDKKCAGSASVRSAARPAPAPAAWPQIATPDGGMWRCMCITSSAITSP